MCWVDSEAQWAGVGWRNVADVAMQLRWLEWRVIWQKAESLWQVHPTPRLYSPGGSIELTVWLQFAVAYFGWAGGSRPPNLPSPVGQWPQSNTMCRWTPKVYTCQLVQYVNVLSRRHECDRRQTTDDRPRYGEMCRNRRNRLRCKSNSA